MRKAVMTALAVAAAVVAGGVAQPPAARAACVIGKPLCCGIGFHRPGSPPCPL